MSEPENPTHDQMEALFVNNAGLIRIKAYLNRFNPIRIMKMERMEIRHSAILAWLLDPAETHGFDDAFLKAFLGEALRGTSTERKPTALDISQSNLRDAEIYREWQDIDIFISSPSNNWAFIIENKFDSTQRKGQLSGYIEKAKKHFKDNETPPAIRGIFLTLQAENPADENYASIRYSAICEILPRLMNEHANQLAHEVKTFLNHYVEVILDATGMSKDLAEMKELARQLYREHKKVLDFVVQNGALSDFAVAARALFGDSPETFATTTIGNQKFVFGLG